MAYTFNKEPAAKFKFNTSTQSVTDKTTLAGINSTLTSADTICDGVASLMAIGGQTPGFYGAVRTSDETVETE